MVREAKKRMRVRYGNVARGESAQKGQVFVLGDTNWSPTLVGLAANSLMEERGGVVCVWGRDGEGRLRGSCRSDGSVSVTDLFANAGDVFVESGGHERSGGFSVSHELVHTLPDVLARVGQTLTQKDISQEGTEHDALVSLSEVSPSLWNEVSQLAPFGIGNEKPLFLISEVIIAEMKRFGKESAHLELSLECRRTGVRVRAFDFFRAPEGFTQRADLGSQVRVLGSIERDSFRGGFAVRLSDILSV